MSENRLAGFVHAWMYGAVLLTFPAGVLAVSTGHEAWLWVIVALVGAGVGLPLIGLLLGVLICGFLDGIDKLRGKDERTHQQVAPPLRPDTVRRPNADILRRRTQYTARQHTCHACPDCGETVISADFVGDTVPEHKCKHKENTDA